MQVCITKYSHYCLQTNPEAAGQDFDVDSTVKYRLNGNKQRALDTWEELPRSGLGQLVKKDVKGRQWNGQFTNYFVVCFICD
jgi:hypothetical protein